jgi:indolepyruvate ferredoxin oxidoreductase beta subunit
MSDQQVRPITLLIAALGGEGGGVLTDWIVAAAAQLDFPVQSTSIPGVAQRTGATTYYIEIVPVARQELPARPVLALAPGIGDVDIVLASELMEAGRAVAGGFVTPDRTLMIASTARSYLVVEKMAMADGRYDSARLMAAVESHARAHLLIDMEALAKESGAMVNAVMLGIIAGCGRLPIPAAAFEGAIRADGKAVAANLAGFRSGLAAAQRASATGPATGADTRATPASSGLAALEREIVASMPAPAHDVILEGARRLAAYQDIGYARLYLDRLAAIRAADARCDAGGRLLRETARQLALRMSYEDVIRVAQAKIDPARLARIAAEMGAKPGEPFTVTEFLKPGIEEMCSILPPKLAARILALADRRGWIERVHWGMEVNTASVSGFGRFWLLAKLRGWRPKSYRYQEEQRAIEAWLHLIDEAARLSGDLALEVAECARLIKGYGDTLKRGTANYRLIESRIVCPLLAGAIPLRQAVDAVASARAAALADPEGEALTRCLAEFEQQVSLRIAAE